MADKTQAEKDAAERVDKAAWMNDQLAQRLPDADYEQPGIVASKDARPDNEYPAPKAKAPKATPAP